jgi:hypothetical protein
MLLILRLAGLLDHLAPTVAATVLANMMRAHQLIARCAGNQRRRIQALVLAAVATAMAGNFCFWCGTHCCILDPFLAFSVVADIPHLLFEQAFQNIKSIITFIKLAATITGVQVSAAIWAEPFTIQLAERLHRKREQRIFAQQLADIQKVVIVDEERVFVIGFRQRNTSIDIDLGMKFIAKIEINPLLRGVQAANAWDSDGAMGIDIHQHAGDRARKAQLSLKLLKCRFIVQRECVFGEGIISPCADILTEQLCDIELQVGHWFVYVHR